MSSLSFLLRIANPAPAAARAVTRGALLALLTLLGNGCSHHSDVTPAEATCAGACGAVPVCTGAATDHSGCISACNAVMTTCAGESRAPEFQTRLACLENANYFCGYISKSDDIAQTTDCGGYWAYDDQLPFACDAGAN